MEIFKLFGTIYLKDNDVDKKLDKVDKKGKSVTKGFGNLIKNIGKWGAVAGAALGGIAVTGGAAMLTLAGKAGQAADRLLDLNSITGMTTDEIQKWEKAAVIAGVGADSMTNASQNLTRSLDTMINSGGKGAEALEYLGLSVEDISNMNADERMQELTFALADLDDKTERAKIGTDLFKGAWKEIAPVIDLGTQGMKNARDNARIISNDDLNAANNFRIAVDEMRKRFEVFSMELAIKFLPIAEKVFGWIEKAIPFIETSIEKTFTVISDIINLFSKDMTNVGSNFELILNSLQESFRFVLGKIQDFWDQWGDQITSVALEVFANIKVNIKNFIDIVISLWNYFGPTVLKIWDNIFKTFVSIITPVMKLIINVVKNSTRAITNIIDMWSKILKGDWKGAWDSILRTLKNIWDLITGVVTNGFEIIKKLFNGSIETLSIIWTKIFSTLTDIVKGAWEMIKEGFSMLFNKIQEWFVNLAKKALQWGKDLIIGFGEGIKAAAQGAIDAVGDFANEVGNKVKGIFKIESPSRLMMEYGAYVAEGFALGVKENKDKAVTEVEIMANSIVEAVDKLKSTVDIDLGIINAEFDLFVSQLGETGDKTELYTNQITKLTDEISVHSDFVDTLKKSYEDMKAQKGENAAETKALYLEYVNEKTALSDLKNELKETKKEYKDYVEETKAASEATKQFIFEADKIYKQAGPGSDIYYEVGGGKIDVEAQKASNAEFDKTYANEIAEVIENQRNAGYEVDKGVARDMVESNLRAEIMGEPQIYHRGGLVTKNGPEDIPALLQPGEFVIPKSLVGKMGGIVVNILNPTIMGDRDADRFGDLIVDRLAMLGVARSG